MSLHKTGASLGEILVESGILTTADLRRGLEEQTKRHVRLGEALVSLGLVTRDDLSWALSRQYALSYVHPRDLAVDPSSAERFPESLARTYNVAPLFEAGDELHVVLDDPLVLESLEEADEIRALTLNVSLGPEDEVRELVEQLYGVATSSTGPMTRAANSSVPPVVARGVPEPELHAALEDASGTALLRLVLEEACGIGVRTVHFDLDRRKGAGFVRFRSDSTLQEAFVLRPDWHATIVALLERLAGQGGRARAAEHLCEGTARVVVRGETQRLPVAFVRGREDEGTSAIVTLQPHELPAPLLSELGLPTDALQRVQLLAARGYGLWIVTGHQWEGSSVAVHALLRHLARPDRRVVSYREDSSAFAGRAEFANLRLARHTAIVSDLETAARADFDVALVPRLFARADVECALEAAAKGRTVIMTTDFRSPRATLRFLLSYGLNRGLLAAALSGILAQREIRLLCPQCRVVDERAPRYEFPRRDEAPRALTAFRGTGCPKCSHTGVRAREFLLELWANDEMLGRALQADDAVSLVERSGEPSLLESGMERVRRGETPLEDVAPLFEN